MLVQQQQEGDDEKGAMLKDQSKQTPSDQKAIVLEAAVRPLTSVTFTCGQLR